MKTIKVCLLFLLFTLIISGCRNAQTKYNDQAYTTNSTSAKNSDNGILYGKYPEPLVIAVGKNMDVNKDYKQVTKEDLKKIKNFYFENEMGKNYPDKIKGTQIRKISPLKKFKNLKEIYADTKNIDDLDQFKDSLIIYENY